MSKSKTNMSEQKIFDDIIDEYGTEGFLLKDDVSPFGIEIAGQPGSMCSAGSVFQKLPESAGIDDFLLNESSSSDAYESFEDESLNKGPFFEVTTEPSFAVTDDSSSECDSDDESSNHSDEEPFFEEDKPLEEDAQSTKEPCSTFPRVSVKHSRRESASCASHCPLKKFIPVGLRRLFGNSHCATSMCITLVCVILGFLIDPIYFLIGILPLIYMLLSVGESGLALKLGTLMILVSMNYGSSIIPFTAIAFSLFVF